MKSHMDVNDPYPRQAAVSLVMRKHCNLCSLMGIELKMNLSAQYPDGRCGGSTSLHPEISTQCTVAWPNTALNLGPMPNERLIFKSF